MDMGIASIGSLILGLLIQTFVLLAGLALAFAAFKAYKANSPKALTYGLGTLGIAKILMALLWLIYSIISFILMRTGSYEVVGMLGIVNSVFTILLGTLFLGGAGAVVMGVGKK